MLIQESLEQFIRRERKNTVLLLTRLYNIGTEEAEDVFQEAIIATWENIQAGKLNELNLTASLATYIKTVCRNIILKKVRDNQYITEVTLVEEGDDEHISTYRDFIFHDEENAYNPIKEAQLQLMERLIQTLPFPCEGLLWGFYRDHHSMRELAAIFGYNNENTAKVKKNQCLRKLTDKFEAQWTMLNK